MTLKTSDQSRKQGEPQDSFSPNSEKVSEVGSHSAESQSFKSAIEQGLRRTAFNTNTTEICSSSQLSISSDYHSRSTQLSEPSRSRDCWISAFQRVGDQNSFSHVSSSQKTLNNSREKDFNSEAKLDKLTRQFKNFRKKALEDSQVIAQGNFEQPDASQDIQQKNSGFVRAGESYASQFTDYPRPQTKPRKRKRTGIEQCQDQPLLRLPPDVQSTNQTSKNQSESQNPQDYQSEIDQGENPLRLEVAPTSRASSITIDNLVNHSPPKLGSRITINNLVN